MKSYAKIFRTKVALFHLNLIQDDEYLIKWKDWPAWTCSWEPSAHLSNALIRLTKLNIIYESWFENSDMWNNNINNFCH